jgi:hypothetical protein
LKVFKFLTITLAISSIALVIIIFINYLTTSGLQDISIDNKKIIYTTTSPNGEFIIDFYLIEPEEMLVSYTILGVLKYKENESNDIKKKNIYLEYGVDAVKVEWIGKRTIIVNEKKIEDILKDVYDWRKE